MRLAIVTTRGELPISSPELAEEIIKRLPLLVRPLASGAVRNAVIELEKAVREETFFLGPEHT